VPLNSLSRSSRPICSELVVRRSEAFFRLRSKPPSNRAAASPKLSIPFVVRCFMGQTMEQMMSRKPENRSENSKMSSVEFVSSTLRERVAPPSLGSTKARIRHASRRLGWSASRTKDA